MLRQLTKWVYKNVIELTVLISIAFIGCNTMLNTYTTHSGNLYGDGYKIGKYSIDEFIQRCSNLVVSSYAPKSIEEYTGIVEEYKDIATVICLEQLSNSSVELTGKDFNNTLSFNNIMYGYKGHQDNGKDKVYFNITVAQEDLSWIVNVEFEIDGENGKIDNINVW